MKLVALSDTHLYHPNDMPEGDVLIHSGDALSRGDWFELVKFTNWWNDLPYQYKIFVPGNHDGIFQEDPIRAIPELKSTYVLIDKPVEIMGYKFYGTPWTPTFYDWWYMASETRLDEIYGQIPEGLDVLITHGPPKWILDQNLRNDHCGSEALARHVQRAKPEHHIFGHIHQSHGEKAFNGTLFHNVAVLDDWYAPVYKPTIIDLEKKF